jgi:hypothetical protein
MQNESPDFFKILEILSEHEVSFIVVGGVCAVLLGAPVTTFNLDIVPSRDKGNRIKLLSALERLSAYYREHLPKKLSPTFESLGSGGHHLLLTKYGPLDILGTIADASDFNHLISHTEKIQLENGIELGILELKTLIEEKEKTKRDKDIGMLSILNAMLKNELDS